MRLCQHCKVKPLGRRANKYCSRVCYGLAKRKPGARWRPDLVGTLCPVCRTGVINSAKARTCSNSCGASSRTDYDVMRAAALKSRARFIERSLERIKEFLRGEVAELVAIASTRALTQADFYKFGARVYGRSYKRGVWYERERWKSGRASQAVRAVS